MSFRSSESRQYTWKYQSESQKQRYEDPNEGFWSVEIIYKPQ